MKKFKQWLIIGALAIVAFCHPQIIDAAAFAFRMHDDGEFWYGTDGDYKMKFDSSSLDLEWLDTADNILMSLADGGTTGALTVDILAATTLSATNLTLFGDLAVNGGDITSSAATVNVMNATPTTVNLGGNASSVVIGNATSTVGVVDDLDVGGTIEAGSGNHVLTNAAGLISGAKIQDGTVDDDSLDATDDYNFATVTTTGNATVGGQIIAGSGTETLTNVAGLIDGAKIQDSTVDNDSMDATDDYIFNSAELSAGYTVTDTTTAGANFINKITHSASGGYYGQIIDSNPVASSAIVQYFYEWNGNIVGRMKVLAGLDDTNKDEASIVFSTSDGGVEQDALTLTQTGDAQAENDIIWGGASSFLYDDGSSEQDGDAIFNAMVGIGVDTPEFQFHIQDSTSNAGFIVKNSGTGRPALILHKENGTYASPTKTLAGQSLGIFSWNGYTGSGDTVGARIEVVTETDMDIDNESNMFLMTGVVPVIQVAYDSSTYIGDAGVTDYTKIDADGAITFTGSSSGLLYGEIYIKGGSLAFNVSSAGYTQVLGFNTAQGFNGVSNGMTPDKTNSHITALTAGIYMATVSMAIQKNTTSNFEVDIDLSKNNKAADFDNVHTYREMGAGSGERGSLSMSGLITLAVNDTIELWITSDDATNRSITVVDCTLSLTMVGGV
jgi:hypothetical protein